MFNSTDAVYASIYKHCMCNMPFELSPLSYNEILRVNNPTALYESETGKWCGCRQCKLNYMYNDSKAKHEQNKHNNIYLSNTISEYLTLNI